jgi:hypothetical protein
MQLGSNIAQSCPDLVLAIRHSPGVLAVCKSSAGNVGIFHLCNASAFCSLGEFLALLDNLNPISTRDFVPCILKCGSECFEHCRMTSWNIVFFLKDFFAFCFFIVPLYTQDTAAIADRDEQGSASTNVPGICTYTSYDVCSQPGLPRFSTEHYSWFEH